MADGRPGRPKGSRNRPKSGQDRLTDIPPGEPGLYPEGAPITEAGTAQEDAILEARKALEIGFDAESARINKVSKEVLQAKGAGKARIDWNTNDMHHKFAQVKMYLRDADVRIEQISPVRDHNIAPLSLVTCESYADLVEYIKRTHWDGKTSSYRWSVWDGSKTMAVGRVDLKEQRAWQQQEDDMASRKNDPYPPQQPPPGWGQPPPHGGWGPPPGYYSQPVPQQIYVQPPPMERPQPSPPPPAEAGAMAQLLHQLGEQNKTIAMLTAEVGQLRAALSHAQQAPPQPVTPPGMPHFPWFQDPNTGQWRNVFESTVAQTAPVAPPPPVKTPVESTEESLHAAARMMKLAKQFADSVNPQPATPPVPEPPKVPEDDSHPLSLKQVGPMRVAALRDTGELLTDPLSMAMFNYDKIEEAARQLFKSGKETLREVTQEKKDILDRQAAQLRAEEEAAERARAQGAEERRKTEEWARRMTELAQLSAAAKEREALAAALTLRGPKPTEPPIPVAKLDDPDPPNGAESPVVVNVPDEPEPKTSTIS